MRRCDSDALLVPATCGTVALVGAEMIIARRPFAGYREGSKTQPESVVTAARIVASFPIPVMFVLQALMMGYNVTKKRHRAMVRALQLHQQGRPVTDVLTGRVVDPPDLVRHASGACAPVLNCAVVTELTRRSRTPCIRGLCLRAHVCTCVCPCPGRR